MLAAVASATLSGAVGRAVSVEVHVSNGLPGFTIVGLPDTAVRKARDRVRAAILSSGLSWPLRRVTVDLAPAAVTFGNHGAIGRMGGGGRPRTSDEGTPEVDHDRLRGEDVGEELQRRGAD